MKKGIVETDTVRQHKAVEASIVHPNKCIGMGLTPSVKKALSLFLSLVMLFCIISGLDFSSVAADNTSKYRVTCSAGVKLRQSYDTSSSQLTSIPSGAEFNVTEKYMSGGYYWGKTTYNNKTGWTALLKTNHSEIYSQCIGTFYHSLHAWIGNESGTLINPPYSIDSTYYFWSELTDSMFTGQKVLLKDSMPELANINIKYDFNGPNWTWCPEYAYDNCKGYASIKPSTYGTYSCNISTSGAAGNSSSVSLTIASYSISFNGNGGSCSVSNKTIAYGGTYGNLPIPTRNGYTFAGWYTSATGGTQVMSSTKCTLSSNQTVYAHWNANNYAVSFNANGGSCSSSSKTVSYGGTYGELPTPTKTGYVFDGWYTSSTGGTRITNSTTVNTLSNQILYAHWSHTHSYDCEITKLATCTSNGEKTYTCTKCNVTKKETIAKTGHNYTVRTYQPTCTENGYVRHQCQNCNDVYVSDYVSPTGHSAGTPVRENIVEATVLTDGSYDEIVYCENCNVQLSRQHKTIPKNSNTISVGETKTAQISEAGKYTYYVFAPTKSEKLKFFSTSNNDTYGYLYDVDMNEITNDDDSGDGNNFCIEYNFEAGKTYVFGCRYYSSSNTGSFDVKLEKSHIHSYSETITYPTCTDKGYTTYSCACGDNYVDNYVNATGHSYNSGRITKSATCTADGEKTYTCTKCGATKKETIAKTGHKYSTQIVNPTCTDGGYTKHICIWCGDEYCDNQTKASGHTWRKSEIVKPTCLSDGYTFYKCADCNEGYMSDYVSATGHDYDNGKVIMYQTCTDDGVKRYTCKNCSHTYDVSIEAMGHDYYTNTVEPTCECDGYKEYVCSRCGAGYIDYMIPATGHSYNSGRITKSPTCESYGEKTYTCYNCGDTTTEQIPKINHSYSSKYISPTCTDDGYTLYTCSYCGYNYRTNYISAKGHSYDSGKITKQPTCSSYGEKTYTCYYCSHTKTESVYPTGHRYTSKKVASTCTKQGYTQYTCTKCNNSYRSNYTSLKTHSNKMYTTKATLSKNGSVVTKCSVCNKTTITTIYYPKTIALSKTSYTYNGKVQKPSVSVKDSNGKVIGAGNYTVAYPSGMKNIGQYTVKITFKGNYSGSVTKTFTIIPKPIDFSSVKSPKKGKVELKWKKASGITGYQIQISSKSNFAAKSTKTLSFKQSKTSTTGKLATKKTHYFRIRTYKTVKVNGKNTNIYSAWSKPKSVKIK